MRRGALYAAGAYALWGLFPLYWKQLQHVPALEILAHRMAWSLVVVALLMAFQRRWRGFLAELKLKTVLIYATSATLLAANWYLYIWAVNAGHVVETSLGYFINPLVNVLLGVLFLGERLRRWQGIAIGIALAGVAYLTYTFGSLPWIALILAGTFGIYGLLRKTAALDSLAGLTLETLVLLPAALAYLLFLEFGGRGTFGHTDLLTNVLLAAAGVATSVPLLLFAAGARRVTLTTMGVLQYLAPTLQFMIGVLVYHEPLTADRLLGFALIWTALAIYTADALYRGRATAIARRAASVR